MQTWVNGKLVADVKDSKSLKGYFGIQHHGKGGVVKFRNLRAKSLD
ncbi:MAG: family 16 glycoside hydrolase [Verrucomicrobiia bacterium]